MSTVDEIREQVEDDRYSNEFVGIVVRARWSDLLTDIESLVAVAEAAQEFEREHVHPWPGRSGCPIGRALDRLQATQPAEGM